LALRLPPELRAKHEVSTGEDDGDAQYSVMAADAVEASQPGPLVGRLAIRGRLLDRAGRRLAGFVQRLTARRGSRILELDIELDVDQQPGAEPWDSYYAARFAWGDSTADAFRSVHLTTQPTEVAQLEAPHFVHLSGELPLRGDLLSTTLFTGGLPYHRRFGVTKLDTLLVVRGETARSFRLGVGIDVPYPVPAALEFLTPEPAWIEAPMPRSTSGWLLHTGAKNVVATHWEPRTEAGKIVGFRTRLLETEGRKARLSLRSFRPVVRAKKVDFVGKTLAELPIEMDAIPLDLGPNEWAEIEADFP
jgi:alpha-mannosidase